MGVKVTGDRQLRKSLATVGRDVNLAGRAALRRGIRMIANRARDLAPIEYGHLESAIETTEKHLGVNAWQETVYVNPSIRASERGSNVRVGKYARYVEDGIPDGIGRSPTSRAKAVERGAPVGPGFIRRAWNRLRPVVKRDVEAAIEAAIARKAAAASAAERTKKTIAKTKAAPTNKRPTNRRSKATARRRR